MFTIIKPGTTIDFVGRRQYAFIVSGVLVAAQPGRAAARTDRDTASISSGGTLVHVRFPNSVEISLRFGTAADRTSMVTSPCRTSAAARASISCGCRSPASDLAGFGALDRKGP